MQTVTVRTEKPNQPVNERAIGLAVLLLVGWVAACYANSLHGALVWDDLPTIVDSKSFEHFATAFDRPPEVTTASGRPLLSLSLAINYAIAKRSLLGLHLTNILIHLVGTLALFGFVRRTAALPSLKEKFGADATWIAFSIAALWAAHPLQTEAVTYIVQRAESMMGAAYLLTLYCFLRSIESSRPSPWWWSAASVSACAAGMMAKEVMVSAPLIVLLFDRIFISTTYCEALRRRRIYYTGLASTWIIMAYLVISLGGNRSGGTGGFSTQAAWLPYWASQFHAIAVYLKLTFFPHPLIFQYGPDWPKHLSDVLPYALVVTPLIVGTLVALVRWPRIGFCGFSFFSVLAPTSIIPGTSDIIVEHRMYLALAPLLGLLVFGVYSYFGRRVLWAAGCVSLIFGGLTIARNVDYKTAIALWQDNVTKRPAFPLGEFNLGSVLLQEPGRTAEAAAHLEKAVKLIPSYPRAHYNLAIALSYDPTRKSDASVHYQIALQLQPNFPEAHNNLGVLLQKEGILTEAVRQFRAALELKPDFPAARENLASALSAAGDTYGAVAEYEKLLETSPTSAIHLEIGSLLANTGHPAEAIPHLEAALRMDPTAVDAAYLLGIILTDTEGRAQDAIELLQRVLQQKPGYAEVHFNLGNALAHFPDRYADAVTQFDAALKLKPDYAEAHFNAATALESFPERRAEVASHYRAYVRLEPNSPDGHLRLARVLRLDLATADEARAEALAALRLNPNLPEAQAILDALR